MVNLTLGSHLEYDRNEGIQTAELSLSFMVLDRLGNREVVMAETERFELSVPFKRYDALAKRWFQPLTHVSGPGGKRRL